MSVIHLMVVVSNLKDRGTHHLPLVHALSQRHRCNLSPKTRKKWFTSFFIFPLTKTDSLPAGYLAFSLAHLSKFQPIDSVVPFQWRVWLQARWRGLEEETNYLQGDWKVKNKGPQFNLPNQLFLFQKQFASIMKAETYRVCRKAQAFSQVYYWKTFFNYFFIDQRW